MTKHILLLTLSCCILLNSMAQQTINSQRNYFRGGDVIIKQQVEFKDPGASGRDIIWDFSHVNLINDKYQLVYYNTTKGDTTHVTGFEHETRYRYLLRQDTLWLTGYENRTTKMDYQQPEAMLRFPFRYGDTLSTHFLGSGLYCQKVELTAEGSTYVTADATGKLITPDNDTLKNVIRIKRIKEFTDIGIDSVKTRLETYQWFAYGCRYPVFETVKSYNINGDNTTNYFSTSFYFSTINKEQLPEDLANLNITTNETHDDIFINCSTYPNPVATDLTVNYELTVDARVSFLLCDISGRPWANVPDRTIAAGVQQMKISMSGLHAGDYGLYISVNGKIYKRTIIKL